VVIDLLIRWRILVRRVAVLANTVHSSVSRAGAVMQSGQVGVVDRTRRRRGACS
jgi:hypothetical protein